MTAITYKLGTTVLGDLTYTYDAAGNRTKIGGSFARTGVPQAIASSSYNAANQQLALADKTMTYDNNGNLTSLTDSNGTTNYTWNARNQLVGISGPNVNASFEYDGLGHRQAKVINASTTEFLYDGVNPVQETDGVNVLANILGGLAIDEVFTRTDSAGASSFLADALGSTVALAESAGVIQTEYTYEPYGSTTVAGVASTNPFQFTGRENDEVTGLYYHRARYYHSGLQRFTGEDPIELLHGGDINLYVYSRNNPVNLTDPTGLTPECCGKWIGRAWRIFNVICSCYWLCVPPEGLIWSGNWFGLPSTRGVVVNTGRGGVESGDACQCTDPDKGFHVLALQN